MSGCGERHEHGGRRAAAGLLRDRPGIVAALSRFLSDRGANIVQSDQHTTDPEGGSFFMRTEFNLDGLEDQAGASSARSPPRSPSRSGWTGG